MVVWKIHIDEEGRTTPVLDLLTKVPEQGNVIHSRLFLSFPVGRLSPFLTNISSGTTEIDLADPNQAHTSPFSKRQSFASCIIYKALQKRVSSSSREQVTCFL